MFKRIDHVALHVSKIESDRRFRDEVEAEGPAAVFKRRNAKCERQGHAAEVFAAGLFSEQAL